MVDGLSYRTAVVNQHASGPRAISPPYLPSPHDPDLTTHHTWLCRAVTEPSPPRDMECLCHRAPAFSRYETTTADGMTDYWTVLILPHYLPYRNTPCYLGGGGDTGGRSKKNDGRRVAWRAAYRAPA